MQFTKDWGDVPVELFKLFGTIAISNSEANEALDETTGKAEKTHKSFSNGIATVGKWAVGLTTAAVGAGTALVGFATQSASTADRIDKLSQKIGLSREAFQELDFICSQSGTNVETLQQGVKTLTNQMQSAADGTASAVEAFDKLGVSIYDESGAMKDQEAMLWEAMSALQGMENQTEKAALANDLLGRSATELMPLLNGAEGSIEAMRSQAHDLGLVLGDEVVDNGVKLTDTIDQMKRSFSSVFTQLGGALMPVIQNVCDIIITNIPVIQSLLGQFEPVATNLLNTLLPIVMQLASSGLPVVFEALRKLLLPLTEIVGKALPPLLDLLLPILDLLLPIVDLLMPVLDLAIVLLGPVISLLSTLLPLVTDLAGLLVSLLLPVIQQLCDFLTAYVIPLINFLVEEVVNIALKGVYESVSLIFGGIVKLIQGALDVVIGITEFFIALFTGDWSGMKESLLKILGGLCDMAVGLLQSAFATMIVGFQNAWSTIQTVLGDIPVKVWEWLQEAILKLIEWRSQMQQKGIEAIASLITGIITKAKEIPEKVKEIGKNIVSGVWEGILGAKDKFMENVGGFFTGIIDGAKEVLDINSPSKKFEWIGQMCVSGFDKGAEDLEDGTVFEKAESVVLPMDSGSINQASGGIDYDRMTQSFIKALQTVAPELRSNVSVEGDAKGMFRVMQKEAKVYKKSTGQGAFA